mgnify:CR=1 FL=1
MRFWAFGLVMGCGDGPIEAPECAGGATYPEGAVEPMELDEVLPAYSWPVAVDRRSGERLPLDLGSVPCDLDADLGWGQFDALLFVSIPAW